MVLQQQRFLNAAAGRSPRALAFNRSTDHHLRCHRIRAFGFARHGGTLQPGRLVISAVEHPAVAAAAQQLQRHGWQLEYWPVDRTGVIQLDAIDRMLSPPTRLVSIGAAQGEVGSLQPLPTVAAICRQRGVILHSTPPNWFPKACSISTGWVWISYRSPHTNAKDQGVLVC